MLIYICVYEYDEYTPLTKKKGTLLQPLRTCWDYRLRYHRRA
uniref:Uncharacterized protein n=1 Tax=Zea mays TaxID=4577 RepID=B7ZZ85_MAIZE|nr:unknown [Zea mays]